MKVGDLISDMQQVKIDHPTLELQEILKIFEIKTMQELTSQLRRLANG